MEAHHPHHVTHKKKWTEYLLEFFMLFLAVFLGFVAENIREHSVENERMHSLAKSLLRDLQNDTAQINFLEVNRLSSEKSLDSFYTFLHTPKEKIDRGEFYRLIRKIYGGLIFSQSRGTIDQLRNAGYLRLFGDSLLHLLSDYDFNIQDYKMDEQVIVKWHDKFMERSVYLLNAESIDQMMQRAGYPEGTGINELTAESSKELLSIIVMQRAVTKVMKAQNNNLKEKAARIIKYLHSSYHLE
ncbi:MAG: hypothetical protein ICV66_05920 [Chitinophagaceae bacterium]|nr:hypothetical protein [Chitinophagaceae bacterium]